MKATGIVRRVDTLGRIVIPKEVRKRFCWDPGTPLEMYVEGETLILKMYPLTTCAGCGGEIKEDYSYCPTCGKAL